MFNYKNASKWDSLSIGEKVFLSPNRHVLDLIIKSPDSEFWLNTYTEFALTIIDKQHSKITCVRDHFGLEPFFYYFQDNNFIFGSNLPDIISHIPQKLYINKNNVMQTLMATINPNVFYTNETNYLNIYRIEPACTVEIQADKVKKSSYWRLSPNKTIHYENESDYVEHFEEILNNVVKSQVANNNDLAIEYSGGLDSSTILTSLYNLGYNPDLFMHIAPPNTSAVDDLKDYGRVVIQQFGLNTLHYIDAENFNLQDVINNISSLFAGNPSYLFAIGANNVHSAVAKNKNKILLSGFGGDECVSSHAPLSLCLKEYAKNNDFKKAFHEIHSFYKLQNNSSSKKIKEFLMILRYINHDIFDCMKDIRYRIKNLAYRRNDIGFNKNPKFNSIQEMEKDLLTGKLSHHVRLRIEDSAIIARKYGFQYKYPLLNVQLINFCNSLPLQLKRNHGENRIIVRQYLSKYLPEIVYQKHHKNGGIMPATIYKMKQEYFSGKLNNIFENLPFQDELAFLSKQQNDEEEIMLRKLFVSVLNNYSKTHRNLDMIK